MKKLEKYFLQQHELALQNLQLAKGVCSEKIMHELRVSIKRIKALLHFVVALIPEETEVLKKYLKKYQKIFKLAGAVRDAQMKQKLVSDYTKLWNLPAPEAYQIHLAKIEKAAFKAFKQYAQTFSLDEKVGNDLKKIWKKEPTENIYDSTETILRQRFTAVRHLIANAQTDEPYHEARKIIKSIYYILHLIFKPESLQQYQDLKYLEETIGDWHDIAVLIDNLYAFGQSGQASQGSFLTKLLAEKQTLQQKIPTLVHEELRCWKIFGKMKTYTH